MRDVELQRVGEHRVGRLGIAPHALRLGVFLDQGDARGRAAGRLHVAQGLGIDREEAAGRAIFRRHVGDGGAVGEREVLEAGAVELDELVDHALLAQHLRDGEHEVGGGGAFPELAAQLEADHFGDQHGDRLAQHGRFRLDAADAPAEHGEAVDHGGVAVGADQGVGIGDGLADLLLALDDLGRLLGGPHHLRQILEVDLVADAGARRHHAEIRERGLAPAQEGVALAVALVFQLDVLLEGAGSGEIVDHHRMVDDEIDGRERIDLLRIAAQLDHRFAHGGEVDHRRHAGEILHQHPRRAIGDLAVGALLLEPRADRLDVLLADRAAVLVAQQVLQQHFQRVGQAREVAEPGLLGRLQAEIIVGLPAHGEGFAGFETIKRCHDGFSQELKRTNRRGAQDRANEQAGNVTTYIACSRDAFEPPQS